MMRPADTAPPRSCRSTLPKVRCCVRLSSLTTSAFATHALAVALANSGKATEIAIPQAVGGLAKFVASRVGVSSI